MYKDNNITTFSKAPTVNIGRSRIPLKKRVWTTFNTGELVPFWVYPDVMAGDTFTVSYSMVIRQTTNKKPTMDDAFIDIFAFAVPWRIVWDHFKEFMGENRHGAWTQTIEYLIPQLITPEGGMEKGTLAEKMEVPIKKAGLPFSALPVRAYVMTVNEWFRDQNLIAPLTEYKDDTDRTASNEVTELGGKLFKVAKYHDYFTSCLPQPQKGEPTTISLGTYAPVIGTGISLGLTDGTNNFGINAQDSLGLVTHQSDYGKDVGTINTTASPPYNGIILGVTEDGEKSGIIADLSQAFAATINAQRYDWAIQRMKEKDARSGSRLREVYYAHFGVTSPDARMQVPEYLHGKHIPLQLVQTAQTSETTDNSPQANLAAYGHTSGAFKGFTKSFTEDCILLVLGAVRTLHSYSQGLPRALSRRRKYDKYWPSLAFLGEQAVLNKEIFVSGDAEKDNEVFGYQERWAEYRYLTDAVTGAFRPDYDQSLSFWIYTDDFENTPVLSQEFIEETTENVDRTLAIQSSLEDQYIANFQFVVDATRPLPVHSIPGLVDHF